MLLIALLLSQFNHAGSLKCKTAYSTFNSMQSEILNTWNQGDIEEIKTINERYDYSFLFNLKHPNQMYFASDWMNKNDVEQSILFLLAMNKQGYYKVKDFKHLVPKANFILNDNEICVVPAIWNIADVDGKLVTKVDIIYIRNLKGNAWRVFNYVGDEEKEDFLEFFPNFPEDIKLSKSTTINELGREITIVDTSLKIYKMLGLEITVEIMTDLNTQQELKIARLKLNGFE